MLLCIGMADAYASDASFHQVHSDEESDLVKSAFEQGLDQQIQEFRSMEPTRQSWCQRVTDRSPKTMKHWGQCKNAGALAQFDPDENIRNKASELKAAIEKVYPHFSETYWTNRVLKAIPYGVGIGAGMMIYGLVNWFFSSDADGISNVTDNIFLQGSDGNSMYPATLMQNGSNTIVILVPVVWKAISKSFAMGMEKVSTQALFDTASQWLGKGDWIGRLVKTLAPYTSMSERQEISFVCDHLETLDNLTPLLEEIKVQECTREGSRLVKEVQMGHGDIGVLLGQNTTNLQVYPGNLSLYDASKAYYVNQDALHQILQFPSAYLRAPQEEILRVTIANNTEFLDAVLSATSSSYDRGGENKFTFTATIDLFCNAASNFTEPSYYNSNRSNNSIYAAECFKNGSLAGTISGSPANGLAQSLTTQEYVNVEGVLNKLDFVCLNALGFDNQTNTTLYDAFITGSCQLPSPITTLPNPSLGKASYYTSADMNTLVQLIKGAKESSGLKDSRENDIQNFLQNLMDRQQRNLLAQDQARNPSVVYLDTLDTEFKNTFGQSNPNQDNEEFARIFGTAEEEVNP